MLVDAIGTYGREILCWLGGYVAGIGTALIASALLYGSARLRRLKETDPFMRAYGDFPSPQRSRDPSWGDR